MNDDNGIVLAGDVMDESAGVRQLRAAVEKTALQMQLKWEEERKERERWKSEDRDDTFYARLVAQLAAAILSEGSVGTRPRSDQVATMAVDYADAVMDAIKKKRAKEAMLKKQITAAP